MWAILLVGVVCVGFFNWKIMLVFGTHLITMQIIKWYSPPNIQVFYLVSHTIWAVIALLLSEKIGAFFMAFISLVYVFHLLGFVPQYPKIIISELLFICGAIIGAFNGPDNGKLVVRGDHFNALFGGRFSGGVSRVAMRKENSSTDF